MTGVTTQRVHSAGGAAHRTYFPVTPHT